MKKSLLLSLLVLLSACAGEPKETYPYGMSEKEWNELSIKDKVRIRRDIYFYERGNINFVNPEMEIEGRKELPNPYLQKKQPAVKSGPAKLVEPTAQ